MMNFDDVYGSFPQDIIQCDYLVIGAGTRGMCFVDGLMLINKTCTVVIVDERESPGGQWHDAPFFFKVGQTSLNYGCPSRKLESNRPKKEGDPPERATKAQVLSYYDSVMEDFISSGRVRYFPNCTANYEGTEIVSNVCGQWTVIVHEKVVDTTYAQAQLPSCAHHQMPFKVHPGAMVVSPKGIASSGTAHLGYVVIGAGRVGMDTMLHLIDLGVPINRLHWVMPREFWWMNREILYPVNFIKSYTRFEDCLLECKSLEQMYLTLEKDGLVFRLDHSNFPKYFHGATITPTEFGKVRRIRNLIRMGHVREVTESQLVLDEGVYDTGKGTLCIDCTSTAIRSAPPPIPIWSEKRITLQLFSQIACAYGELNVALCAAVTGYCEASLSDWKANNARCDVTRWPDTIWDWEQIHYEHYSTIDSFLEDKKVQWKLLRTRPSNLAMLNGTELAHFSNIRQTKMVKRFSSKKNATLARAAAAKVFMESRPPERLLSPPPLFKSTVHVSPERVAKSTQTDPESEDEQ
mmetsp:Transcript_46288/g.106864  ORF Transcript_46288/g.106864 Transcript_46288/m.106864 type:complete len:520 (+) Transcript_46288:89-1648(+)